MRFRPSLPGTVAVLLLLALFVRLGLWQLDRAGQKRAEHERYLEHGRAAAVDLSDAVASRRGTDELLWRPATAQGRFLRDRDIVLDNQSYQGRPGYLVLSPFVPGAGLTAVLANRGWMPIGERRDTVVVPAAPEGELRISGRIGRPPAHGIHLAGEEVIERLDGGVRRVQSIDYAALEKELHLKLRPYVMLLEVPVESGLTRAWTAPGSDEARHLGYAVQWFAMACALAAVYVVVSVRRAA